MQKITANPPYYRFKIFEDFAAQMQHALSTREHKDLDSGQNREIEAANRTKFGELIKMQADKWVFTHQVHGDEIHIVDEALKTPYKFEAGDALITNVPGKTLFVKMADCQALLMFDPVKRVVAAVHSGWRGSVQNIIGKTARKMRDEFGCNAADIRVGISYSLGPCCSYFTNPHEELPQEFHKYILEDGHCVGFWQCSEDQLLVEGILKNNIEIARICTKCHTDKFYSYRSEKGKAGRMGAVIGLKSLTEH